MNNNARTIDLRQLVEQGVAEELQQRNYREAPMRAFELRRILAAEPSDLPRGIIIEDENSDGAAERNRPRISSAALPYLWDLRRAVILGLWFDEVLKCSIREGSDEVVLMWPAASALKEFFTVRYIGQVENVETRITGVLFAVSATLEYGDDYLVALWSWLRAASQRDQERRPYLCHVTDSAMVENLCVTYLSRNLVLFDEIDAVLIACGFSAIRARLHRQKADIDETARGDALLEPKDAAKLLGITAKTLNNKKSRGQVPRSVYVEASGRRIKYRRKELWEWWQGKRAV